MNIDWGSALTVLGSNSVLILAATWLLRKVISEQLARDTEAFKARIKADADVEIEKLKNALQIAATEHQVMFSKMHEQRAEVIDQVYEKLTEIQSSAGIFALTSENNPQRELQRESYDAVRKKLNEYFSFVERHRIFLPTEICDMLENHLHEIRVAVHLAGAYGGERSIFIPRVADQSYEAFNKIYDAFAVGIPNARKVLEAEFRRMLGVK
jgi:hypothetical protein